MSHHILPSELRQELGEPWATQVACFLSPRVIILPQTLRSMELQSARRKVGTLQDEHSEAREKVDSLERECAALNGAVEVCLPSCDLSRAVSLIVARAIIRSGPCHG